MIWSPALLAEAGPWAILVALVLAFLFARGRGWLLVEKDVDRAVDGYREVIQLYRQQIEHKEAALQAEIARGDRLDRQVERLLDMAELTNKTLQTLQGERA